MEIEKEVTEFVKTINRGPLKEYFPQKKEDIDWDKEQLRNSIRLPMTKYITRD